MNLKQISVFVENKPGAIFAPCNVLAEAGINLSAITLADTADFGILRFITKETERAAEVLRRNHFAVNIADVLAVRIEDTPGALAKVLKILEDESLDLLSMYAAVRTGNPIMIFRFNNTEQAFGKLSAAGCTIVDEETFFA